jgi:hypothetical protein
MQVLALTWKGIDRVSGVHNVDALEWGGVGSYR